MNKFIILVILIAGVLNSTCLAKDIEVLMDGEKIVFDTAPILEDSRTLVPFRKIFETLGYKVSWDGDKRKVNATKKGKEIELIIDDKNIIVNNKVILSDVAPKIINSRTYVPIRIVSEYSDCDVLWDDATKTVLIYTKQGPYEIGIQDMFAKFATDGKYIYYSPYEGNTYRFTEDLQKEVLPFQSGNGLTIYKNKLYARVENEKYKFHYESIDLKNFKMKDISNQEIEGCVIYNGKIYYEYFPLPIDKEAKNSGIYVMDINGKNKKQICYSQYRINNFYVTDDYIFAKGKMYEIKSGKEKILTDYFITATGMDDEIYYMAINEYKGEAFPLTPIGVYAYNYKTGETKLYPFDKEIVDIEVTDNSIYMTWENDSEYSKIMNYRYNGYTYSYFIVRLTKDFKYPVEIYKGTNYLETCENGEKISWYGGVSSEIEVIGNYVYFNYLSTSGNIVRISTDGKEVTNLNEFWKYDVKEEENKDYKYTIVDFTDELRNKGGWK